MLHAHYKYVRLVLNICIFFKQNLPASLVESVGGKIFTFGSYRLGVHTKGKFFFNLFFSFRFLFWYFGVRYSTIKGTSTQAVQFEGYFSPCAPN